MIIRESKISDAKGIAKVHVDCWRTTYRNIIPDEFLEKLSYEQRTALWIKNLFKDDNYVFVAENNLGEVIGFADGGKRETNTVENSADLTSIYILEQYQGLGIGRQLLRILFLQFEKLSINRVFVEVLEGNKSRYFYEAFGAEWIQTEKVKIAGSELNLLVYEWKGIGSVLNHT
ncbi:GNAT family N-acetyltransferase [Paenibacillus sp. FSL L8-0340]|uniref:GNAT family N-acetyltransferase n=2 Tax=unclassified Paenibacillus TaxID=185978 RepID=UPI003158BD4E